MLKRDNMTNLITLYCKFWEMLQSNINKMAQFLDICKNIIKDRDSVDESFVGLKQIVKDLIEIDVLREFYHTHIIFQPYFASVKDNSLNVS